MEFFYFGVKFFSFEWNFLVWVGVYYFGVKFVILEWYFYFEVDHLLWRIINFRKIIWEYLELILENKELIMENREFIL